MQDFRAIPQKKSGHCTKFCQILSTHNFLVICLWCRTVHKMQKLHSIICIAIDILINYIRNLKPNQIWFVYCMWSQILNCIPPCHTADVFYYCPPSNLSSIYNMFGPIDGTKVTWPGDIWLSQLICDTLLTQHWCVAYFYIFTNGGMQVLSWDTTVLLQRYCSNDLNLYTQGSGGGSSKIVRGTGSKNLGLGVAPSKTHQFWYICFLPMENFATFLDFSFIFLIFCLLFFFLLGILGPHWQF